MNYISNRQINRLNIWQTSIYNSFFQLKLLYTSITILLKSNTEKQNFNVKWKK